VPLSLPARGRRPSREASYQPFCTTHKAKILRLKTLHVPSNYKLQKSHSQLTFMLDKIYVFAVQLQRVLKKAWTLQALELWMMNEQSSHTF
jgi:hypothetical protein